MSTIASLGRASGVPEDSSRGRHSEEATVLKLLGLPVTRAHHSEDEIPVKVYRGGVVWIVGLRVASRVRQGMARERSSRFWSVEWRTMLCCRHDLISHFPWQYSCLRCAILRARGESASRRDGDPAGHE